MRPDTPTADISAHASRTLKAQAEKHLELHRRSMDAKSLVPILHLGFVIAVCVDSPTSTHSAMQAWHPVGWNGTAPDLHHVVPVARSAGLAAMPVDQPGFDSRLSE